mmetsp:Transcript_13891/g.20266  ORF Transcript_13891/g.20266 Transcript_13891/m.20266 type:complete len:440 (-) Transcript_13891:527-1846(-)
MTTSLTTQPLSQHQTIASNASTASLTPETVHSDQIVSMPSLEEVPMQRTDARRKKSKKTVEVPMFLRKTYHMVNASNESIVCWSKDGNSFIIKDVDSFTSKIIPQFFNHKNFKSFVRQLNFYGFHKVKTDRIRKDTTLDRLESKHWRFRHTNFRKGRPDLLEEIQKSKHNAVASQEDVDSLKDEVRELKNCIAIMAANIGRLTSFIDNANIQMPAATEEAASEMGSPRKKRKIEADETPSFSMDAKQVHNEQPFLPSIPPKQIVMESNYNQIKQEDNTSSVTPLDVPSAPIHKEEVERSNDTYQPGTIMPAKRQGRQSSFCSIGSFNQDFLELFEDDLDQDKIIEQIAPDIALSSIPEKINSQPFEGNTRAEHDEQHDKELWARLHDSFTALPKEKQEFLAKHLDEAIASPDKLHNLINVLSASFSKGYIIPSVVPPEG